MDFKLFREVQRRASPPSFVLGRPPGFSFQKKKQLSSMDTSPSLDNISILNFAFSMSNWLLRTLSLNECSTMGLVVNVYWKWAINTVYLKNKNEAYKTFTSEALFVSKCLLINVTANKHIKQHISMQISRVTDNRPAISEQVLLLLKVYY